MTKIQPQTGSMIISNEYNSLIDDFSSTSSLSSFTSSPTTTVIPPSTSSSSSLTLTFESNEFSGNSLGELFHTVGLGVTLAALILTTIVGNVFVIIAILMEKNLRSVGNYLVLSLAIADLMVACLVMPLGAVYEVAGEWILGPQWCDIWTCADVLCCTASILHLLAIAIDRYWAVTNIDYIHNRNPNRIGTLIICIWSVAAVISIAPVLGWKDPDFEKRLRDEKKCLVSQDVAYQIVATFATFYGPLVFILLLYWRIYQVARKRIRRKPGTRIVLNVKHASCDNSKSLSVPCNIEVTTTNFSSDMSTNTTLTTTTASNPSPERSFASQRFSVCPSITSQVIEESSVIVQESSLGVGIGGMGVTRKDGGTCPVPMSSCEIANCNSMNSVPVDCSRNYQSSTLSPAKECLISPVNSPLSNNNRSGPSTPSTVTNLITTIERDKFNSSATNHSETCDGSTIDIDDDWNLIGQEISVTSDVMVTCDSKGTTYHYTSPSQGEDGPGRGGSSASDDTGKSCSRKSKTKSKNISNSRRKMLRITTSLISPNREKTTKNYGSCGSGINSVNGRDSIESKRERKAAKTLAIITGIFVICWLPFFIVALLLPVCGDLCNPPTLIISLFQWLGYVNSMLNPVIYTIFSADFRTAFKKILLGKRAFRHHNHRAQNRV